MARILITSALPYINGVKHLGNLIGSQLPSDTYARFMRSRGNEVLLICATDEHGTPAELAAEIVPGSTNPEKQKLKKKSVDSFFNIMRNSYINQLFPAILKPN